MKNFLLYISLFLSISAVSAQVPGQIYKAATATPNPLDPNGDGWITMSGAQFTSAANEEIEQEMAWQRVFDGTMSHEPGGDVQTGGSNGQTDLVGALGLGYGTSAYYYYDNTLQYALFRLRIAANPTGNFGYAVLIDTDELFGNGVDPNYVAASGNSFGNPGFEIEIRIISNGGNAGVTVWDVDGVIGKNATLINEYPLTTHTQRAVSMSSDSRYSGANAIFLDFFVPVSDLGIMPTDPIRIVPATSINGTSVLGGTASDIGGVDDNDPSFTNNHDAFQMAINDQGSGSSLLPVELVSFRLNPCDNKSVMLSWTTAREFNTSHFIVERTNQERSFTAIGIVNAVGFSHNINTYSYNDLEAIDANTYYYRLKIVDFDGTYSYSNTIALSFIQESTPITVYPNPVKPGNVITIDTEQDLHNVTISDISGRMALPLEANNCNHFIIPDNINSGGYILIIDTENGKRETHQIIVQ